MRINPFIKFDTKHFMNKKIIRTNPFKSLITSGFFILSLAFVDLVAAQQLIWKAEGPSPSTGGMVDGIIDKEVAGAVQAVAPHPKNANIVYIGAVNGGIWKTENAMAAKPFWRDLTKNLKSSSIGALEFDPTDNTNRTLVAGTGRFSSYSAEGGARVGLYRTVDGGINWTTIDGKGQLAGLNISGVAPRGRTIVISVSRYYSNSNSGIWRSIDGGQTWAQVSGTISGANKLPTGNSYDLVGDPTNPKILFTNFGSGGIYRSDDTGATWNPVSDNAMNSMMSSMLENVQITVGKHNNIYVAIVNDKRLKGVFRSGNSGKSWTKMDLPKLASGLHPGGQGGIHLSIAADPNDKNIVYIGGDRQTGVEEIGAEELSGRLFRGNASKPFGERDQKQWVHLTHSRVKLGTSKLSYYPVGGGTANNTAPHSDSRDMDFAVNGVLIEGDDGGVYRRTQPENNKGDWFSMNGNLNTIEFHSAAWDSNANIIIGGAQDNGTPQQLNSSNVRWKNVSDEDGGVVAVDSSSAPGFSIRYFSKQALRNFRREKYDSSNKLQSMQLNIKLLVVDGDHCDKTMTTPFKLNEVDPTRIIFGCENSVYESLTQGDTLKEVDALGVSTGVSANAFGRDTIAYGAVGNPNILYVGGAVAPDSPTAPVNRGNRVYVRTGAYPAKLIESQSYPGARDIEGIANNPNHPNIAFVTDDKQIYLTTTTGARWTEITGNLGNLNPGNLHSIAYSERVAEGEIVVGGETGVFSAPGPAFKKWSRLGTGFPTVPVYELEYNKSDNLLLAGTLGRGAWILKFNRPRALPWLGVLLD